MATMKCCLVIVLVLVTCLQEPTIAHGRKYDGRQEKNQNHGRLRAHEDHHIHHRGHHKHVKSGANLIDSCWMQSDWISNRKNLANCGIGFGSESLGGRDGEYYIVTKSEDDIDNPSPGTLRHGIMQSKALWIYFATDMTINLKTALQVTSYKTIDGRGATIKMGNGQPCLEIKHAKHVIIESLYLEGCSTDHLDNLGDSDGDAIHIQASTDIWIDHNMLSKSVDGLVDVTHGSTIVTISNNYFHDQDKVMLMGHDDTNEEDKNMKVTLAYNTFGSNLVQRMPRCRLGEFHIMNNDYTAWDMYAIGGSPNPTILSEGNRYSASSKTKVTKRETSDAGGTWKSHNDVFENGAWFEQSGLSVIHGDLTSSAAGIAQNFATSLTMNSGPITSV